MRSIIGYYQMVQLMETHTRNSTSLIRSAKAFVCMQGTLTPCLCQFQGLFPVDDFQ